MSSKLFSTLVGSVESDMINNHFICLPKFSLMALKLLGAKVKNLQIHHQKFHYTQKGKIRDNFAKFWQKPVKIRYLSATNCRQIKILTFLSKIVAIIMVKLHRIQRLIFKSKVTP